MTTAIIILLSITTTVFLALFWYSTNHNSKIDLDNPIIKDKLEEQAAFLRSQNQAILEESRRNLDTEYNHKQQLLDSQFARELELAIEKEKLISQQSIKEEENKMRERIFQLQEKLEQREEKIDSEKIKIESIKEELRGIREDILSKKNALDLIQETREKEFKQKLESISKITEEEARKQLTDKTYQDMGQDLLTWQRKFLLQTEEDANIKAREIVALAIQRCSSEVANEFTVTNVKLDNDDDKGKLIGKGGRNIHEFEKLLGVELIIDDTPGVMTISGFSSVRRHVAKRTIELLLEDGRVHPSSIKVNHAKAQAEIAQEIADAGQWAVDELGIIDIPAKLIRILGRLRFRSSYGQNMLKHSVEMAKLAGLIAEDMNAAFSHRSKPIRVDLCMKGALFHDIGKAVNEETEPKGNHITLGEKICETFNLDPIIKKCISSHHDESYYDEDGGFCIEAAIVDACDNISGGRPGSRKEAVESYMHRMNALEKIANDTPGVDKSWIMQGGRQLWVFFDTTQIPATRMHEITKDIAKRIQTEMVYPGEIKVVGMWESQVIEYAM